MQSSTKTPMLPIAVPGARGAYSQTAARRFFGTNSPVLACKDSGAAVRAIAEGRASHAVIPVENSITGAFHGVADAFFQGDVAIVGEVLLPIRHALLAVPGTRLEDLSVVCSHATTLAQCRDWIASWSLATAPVPDTAEAAEGLAASGDSALGVIGNREMAASYGLEILAEGLSDRPDNRTRFLVLGDVAEQGEEGLRFAVQVGPVRTPRLLKTLRIQLESLGASRVRVPFLGSEDGRRFLVEFDHRKGDGPRALESACGSLPHRFLGAWSPTNSPRRAG
ncbi:MAG TPA: hypothetical protein ENJ09_10835 [Planctomycetes bacterium]|nr:hypothetical protein [Planctomycetota bacterium]